METMPNSPLTEEDFYRIEYCSECNMLTEHDTGEICVHLGGRDPANVAHYEANCCVECGYSEEEKD